MDQKNSQSVFPLKAFLWAIVFSLLSVFLFLALFSLLLTKIHHFERFYTLACWLLWAVEAVVMALIARSTGQNAWVFSLTAGLIVALVLFAIGLIVGGGGFHLVSVGSRMAFYLVLSVVFSILPIPSKGRKRRKFKR